MIFEFVVKDRNHSSIQAVLKPTTRIPLYWHTLLALFTVMHIFIHLFCYTDYWFLRLLLCVIYYVTIIIKVYSRIIILALLSKPSKCSFLNHIVSYNQPCIIFVSPHLCHAQFLPQMRLKYFQIFKNSTFIILPVTWLPFIHQGWFQNTIVDCQLCFSKYSNLA